MSTTNIIEIVFGIAFSGPSLFQACEKEIIKHMLDDIKDKADGQWEEATLREPTLKRAIEHYSVNDELYKQLLAALLSSPVQDLKGSPATDTIIILGATPAYQVDVERDREEGRRHRIDHDVGLTKATALFTAEMASSQQDALRTNPAVATIYCNLRLVCKVECTAGWHVVSHMTRIEEGRGKI